MDTNSGNAQAFVMLGPALAVVGLLVVRFMNGGGPEAIGWAIAIAGALVFLAGLIGYALKN